MAAGGRASNIINRILGLLKDEAKLFQGVDGEIVDLEVDLKNLQTTMEDVEASESESLDVKEWLEIVAYSAQRLEISMDAFLLQMAQRRQQGGFTNFVRQTGELIKNLKSGHAVAFGIQDIKAEIRQIKDVGERYDIFSFQDECISSTYIGERLLDFDYACGEKSFVDVDSQKEQLQSVLVGEPSTRLVISLVGIGGVGKTSLASIVYKSEMVAQQFHYYAWINVSQSYNLIELLKQLGKTMCPSLGCNTEKWETLEEITSCLNQLLWTKRYLIVFDDVWQTDFWVVMNHVLPDNDKGSRIIITARNSAIASYCDIVQRLQPLSEERALELFYKLKFRSAFGSNCPPELEEFVRRCHGLPLVIKAIASYLSTKNNVLSEWKELLDQFNNRFEEVLFLKEVVSIIFNRSYNDLPFQIRLCFLYFGIFPKGYSIPDLKLCKLWIAEGFVKKESDKTLEDVAKSYLNELINRHLVQVSYVNYYSTERMCRIQGFMHDVILSRTEEFHVLNKESPKRRVRHLSIDGDMKNILETFGEAQVRSILLFNVSESISNAFVVNLFERFKFLGLLDFENAPFYYLPDEVGNLFLLKYLSLRNTKVKKLPKSIGLLLNLQTLDVRNTLMHELPIQILKLRKLQHLLASSQNDKFGLDSSHGVRIKKGIGYLENLKTLLTVEAHGSGFSVIEELEKLKKLKWLGISKLTSSIVNTLCTSIEKKNHLESLSLYSANGREVFDLEAISSPPPSLRRLILKCQLEKFPGWILKLQNLRVLGLSFSSIAVDSLKALHCLPNLESLWLHRAYISEKFYFQDGSFRKLKQLALTKLYNLRMIRIGRGALPLLEELRIGPSPDELLSDIQHLRNLQVLEYYDMPNKPGGGLDYWRVEHVPSVLFWYRVERRRYILYKLGEPDLLDHLQGLASNIDNIARHEGRSSFYNSDDDDDDEDSAPTWVPSSRASFFSDDIED